MATSNRVWNIVRVPFPYTDRPVRQFRPALVVANPQSQTLLWVLMITSAENRGCTHDVPISNFRKCGLPIPSLVRCAKIATIDASEAEQIGTLPAADRKKVALHLGNILALT